MAVLSAEFFLLDHGKDLCVKIAKLITRDNLFPLSFFLFRFFFFCVEITVLKKV